MGSPNPYVMVLDPKATPAELAAVQEAVGTQATSSYVTCGDGWCAMPLVDGASDTERISQLSAVQRLVQVSSPYRLASRELFAADVGVHIPLSRNATAQARGPTFGGGGPLGIIVTSRWASASETRFESLAPLLAAAGCSMFHAGQLSMGAERDPSSPGFTTALLRRLGDIAHDHDLALSVEVSNVTQIAAAVEVADVLQVGSGNMQDFSLLREIGRTTHPIILRRGASATVEEFLLAAEYVLVHGNGRVILCESGIRTFGASQKGRFEINAVPVIRRLSHLPLVADPSRTAPNATAVPSMARAAIAAGADGLVLEVGNEAAYDLAGTAIDIETMRRLIGELRPIARAIGRSLGGRASDDHSMPTDAITVLERTETSVRDTIESLTNVAPTLDVVAQWRLAPPVPWLSPPLSPDSEILARCTSHRIGSVLVACNLSYVDLARIDPTLEVLLEAEQVNLEQLFVDPRIERRGYEFGSSEGGGPADEVFRRFFPDALGQLYPYVWRRYEAGTNGGTAFLVIEILPTSVWQHVLSSDTALSEQEGIAS